MGKDTAQKRTESTRRSGSDKGAGGRQREAGGDKKRKMGNEAIKDAAQKGRQG